MSEVSSSSSGEIIAENEDLLSQILLRLSAKQLVIFKTVCKNWLSLISSPYFCRSLSAHSKVILKSSDGKSFLVDESVVARESKMIKNMIEQGGNDGITLPEIKSEVLAKVIFYCYYKHSETGANQSLLCAWEIEFMGVDISTAFLLNDAARYLGMEDLWDLSLVQFLNLKRLSDNKKVVLRRGDGKSFLVYQMIKEEEQPPMAYNAVEDGGGGKVTLPLITSEILEKVIVHSYKARENSDRDRVWNWKVEFAGAPLGIVRRLLAAARYLDI